MQESDQFLTTDQHQAQHHLTAAAQVTAGHQVDLEESVEAKAKLNEHELCKSLNVNIHSLNKVDYNYSSVKDAWNVI